MSRMFISHSISDREFVEDQLLELLAALGFETWFAETDILSSEQWERSILSALRSSRWFLLVLSRQSANSEWVKDEVAYAMEEMHDRVIVIRTDNADARSIHIRLPRLQFINYTSSPRDGALRLTRTLIQHEYKPLATETSLSSRHQLELRKFWNPLVEGGLQIVLGRFLCFAGFEASGLIGTGDAEAMAEVRSTLEAIGCAQVAIAYSDVLAGSSLRTNLLLLGGPDPNLLTRDTMKALRTTLRFGDPRIREIGLYDTKEGTYYAPTIDSRSNVTTDFGLLICATSPFSSDKRVIIAAGSFGHGTLACVRHLLSLEFLNYERTIQDCESLITCNVVWDAPQRISTVVYRPLN